MSARDTNRASAAETRVRLVVLEFECAADEISRVLGCQPTMTWRAGDAMSPRALNTHKQNGWLLKSPLPPTHPGEDSIRALLLGLPDLDAFARLPAGTDVQLTCTLYGYSQRPYLWIPADLIVLLGRIRANLDVDTYDLTEA